MSPRRGLRPRPLATVVRSKATWAFAAERQVVRQTARVTVFCGSGVNCAAGTASLSRPRSPRPCTFGTCGHGGRRGTESFFTSSSCPPTTMPSDGWRCGSVRVDTTCQNRTSGDASTGDWRCSSKSTGRPWMSGIIGTATKEDSGLASTRRDEPLTPKLAVLLEAARRATRDALHGPRHLRSGRFRPTSSERVGTAAQDVAADDASRRS